MRLLYDTNNYEGKRSLKYHINMVLIVLNGKRPNP